jgi:Lipopolysaccharide-assembly
MVFKGSAALFLLTLFLVGGGACAYHFQAVGKPVGLDIQSIAVPLVESPASTLGFEGQFTRIIRQQFIDHSALQVVSRDQADAVLELHITQIRSDPQSYETTRNVVQGRTLSYEVTKTRWLWLKMNARLVNRKSGTAIWNLKGMEEKAAYTVSSDPLETRYNRQAAVQTIAQNMANRLYAQTMERF